MNKILNYINATLVSLDIPPIIKQQSKKSYINTQNGVDTISAESK